MSELKPCPFCGGEDLEIDHAPTYDVHHSDVYELHCPDCGGRGGEEWTEAEAIAAWNTRAEYHGYEDAAVEAWKRIKAYQERTCRNTDDDCDAWFKCSECGFHSKLEIMSGGYGIPNYCPNCGSRVVGE